MADFDPYHVWLGIRPEDRPPNHYQLLGITPYEDDLHAIEAAALKQTMFLRSLASGEHDELISQLLNEVSAARVCLCNQETRSKYDTELMVSGSELTAIKQAPTKVNSPAVSHESAKSDKSATSEEVGDTPASAASPLPPIASSAISNHNAPSDSPQPRPHARATLSGQPIHSKRLFEVPGNNSGGNALWWLFGLIIVGLCIIIVLLFWIPESSSSPSTNDTALIQSTDDTPIETFQSEMAVDDISVPSRNNTPSADKPSNSPTVPSAPNPIEKRSLIQMQLDGSLENNSKDGAALDTLAIGNTKFTNDRYSQSSNALRFTKGALRLGFNRDFVLPPEFTISFWMKPTIYPDNDQMVLDWGDLAVYIDGSSNELYLQLNDSTILKTGFEVSDRWHHVTVSVGQQFVCTINGIVYLRHDQVFLTDATLLLLGNSQNGDKPYYGSLDEFRLLNYSESNDEVLSHYIQFRLNPAASLNSPNSIDNPRFSLHWSQQTQSIARALSFSSDSSAIAAGLEDNSIQVYNIEDPMQLIPLRSHDDQVTSVDFSAKNGRLISGGRDSTFKIWNSKQRYSRQTYSIQDSSGIQVAFANLGKCAFAFDKVNPISANAVIADDTTISRNFEISPSSMVGFAVHPRANIATWLFDNDILLSWNVVTGAIKKESLMAFNSQPSCMTYSRFGDIIAIGHDSGEISFYDTITNSRIDSSKRTDEKIQNLIWGKNGDYVVFINGTNAISILNLAKRGELKTKTLDGASITCLALDNRGQYIGVGRADGTVSVWTIR